MVKVRQDDIQSGHLSVFYITVERKETRES